MSTEDPGGDKQQWLTPLQPLGQRGLQISRSVDRVDPDGCTYLINFVRDRQGRQAVREGQQLQAFFPAGTTVHSICLLNDRLANDYTRFWIADTKLYRGKSGGVAEVASGLSGLPASMIPHRPTLTGLSYLYLADDNKMLKLSRTGAEELIGVAPPPAATTAVVGAARTKIIASMAAGDNTAAVNWGHFPGFDRSTTPVASGTPTSADVVGPDGNGVAFTTVPGSAATAYNSGAHCGMNRDFTTFDGVHDVADDDLIHLYLCLDHPEYIEEVRVYFVASAVFFPNCVPGTVAGQNEDAYVKSFRPSNLAYFVAETQSAQAALSASRLRQLEEDYANDYARWGWNPEEADPLSPYEAAYQLKRRIALEMAAGAGTWSEFGRLGVPLRRGDFVRIGTSDTRNWSNITGMVIVIQTNINRQVIVGVSGVAIRGGYGPDTSDPAATQYDFRHTSYNVVTGEEGNPSPVIATGNAVDAARQPIVLDAAVTGNADIHPRYYARGGMLLTNDWYYVGQGTSDGDPITWEGSEEDALAAGGLEVDNDQPITTVNAAGTAIYAQPVRILFGPDDNGVLYALGDRYRPGHVYYSKPNRPGSWPAANRVEVSSPSDSLLNGCVYGGQGYVFTYSRMLTLIPNLRQAGQVAAQSTACTEGLAAPWGMAVGLGGIYFVSRSGIRVTTGGPSTLIAEDLRPIFEGKDAFGLKAINMGATSVIRLNIHLNELHFHYQDTDGAAKHLIFTITPPPVYWREAQWAYAVRMSYSEMGLGGSYFLLGGLTNGKAFYQGGYDDFDGVTHAGIVCRARTGAWYSDDVEKLLGDCYLDAEFGTTLPLVGGGVDVNATVRINGDTQSMGVTAIAPDTPRKPFLFQPFGTEPQKARDVSVDIELITAASITFRPYLYRLGVSYLPLGRPSVTRTTDWDDCGSSAEKWVTGVIITADTDSADLAVGVEKELYGTVSEITEIVVNHAGRRRKVHTWPGTRAQFLRLRSKSNNPWTPFQVDWIVVPEPLALTRWECRETNFGVSGWYMLPYAHVTLEATADVTLTVTTHHNQAAGSTSYPHTLLSTAGAKRSRYVKLDGLKGVLTKFVFTSAAPFQIYPEESWVLVQPFSGGAAVSRQPFGKYATDLVQGIRSLG